MAVTEDSMIHELKSRIKLLEKQYAQSAGYMEEKLLLWLVTESINQSETISDLLFNLLDQVSVLLELPYAACCEINEQELQLISQFTQPGTDTSGEFCLSIGEVIIGQLNGGPLIISKDSPFFPSIDFKCLAEDDVKEIAFYPFQSISVPSGVFIFISSKATAFKFNDVGNAMSYLVNIAVEKIEKLSLRDELKELNQVFESRLKERTSDLELQVKQMKKELVALRKKVDIPVSVSKKVVPKPDESLDYLKSVGIEVRTPLNGILGFSELLRSETKLEEGKEDYIDIIKSCGKSILKIVDDAVELSRLEQENRQAEEEEIKLSEFMTELYDHYKKDELFQQRKDVELKLNINIYETAKINSDIRFLSQILSNLIGNAIKFTSRGTIEIGCMLVEQSADVYNSDIRFFIKDTGVGIHEDVSDKIFDRFYKVEHEIAKLIGGLGLGLTISKILVEKLGGTIGFESSQGKGSEFFFTLPSSVIIPGSLTTNGVNGFEQKYQWDDKRILIVEDDKMSLIYLQEVLKSTAVEIIHVEDGKAAIEIAKNDTQINLILMDIKLPGISGYEATEIIRRFSDVPIIAQTAYAMADDYKRMLQVGCNDYISKPINRRKLLKKIDTIFMHHSE